MNSQGAKSMFSGMHSGLKGAGYVGVGMTALDFKMNLDQGQGVGTAAIKSAASYAMWTTAAPAMWTYTAATMGAAGVSAAYQWRREQAEKWHWMQRPTREVGGGFNDTSRAQTMRQAAVQAIQGSKLNARSALGGEARLFHNNSGRY